MTIWEPPGENLFQACDRLLDSANDRGFLRRVWTTEPWIHQERLAAAGLTGHDHILDAGSGFGQWSAALSRLNRRVTALEFAADRSRVARLITDRLGRRSIGHVQGSLERLPFADRSFDALFCFSVLYLTDYRVSVAELFRVLKPGGCAYMQTNGLGWYLHNLLNDHNPAADFSPRKMAMAAIDNAIRYHALGAPPPGGVHGQMAMPGEAFRRDLAACGFEILAFGPDGSINLRGEESSAAPRPFYPAEYDGFEGVHETLCRRPS